MGKRVVFTSIFDLTRVFFEVSKGLAEAGHNISWITTDPHWTEWLVENGTNRSDILQLVYSQRDFLDSAARDQILPEIVRSEHNADITANQSLLVDQFVASKNKPDIDQYVFLYYRDIKRFLTEKKITHLVAEPTNVTEMIAYMICRELGINYISPRVLRYPQKRLIFFDSYLQENPYPRAGQDNSIVGKELVDDFIKRKPEPYYFIKNKRLKIIDPKKLMKSIGNRVRRGKITNQDSLTHHDLSGRVKLILKRQFNAQYLKYFNRYSTLDELPDRIAFFGLHVQPEASIDVLGAYFSDQLKLIKDIRRALPFDTTLVVKEHPNFIGQKGIHFFSSLRRIPNVKLIHHNVSTFDIFGRTSIVFTISGTIGYEAGLLGIPVVTFSPMYFSGLSSVHYCTDMTKLRPLVYDLIYSFKRDYEHDCRFMEELVIKSYDVLWSDPNFYPEVLGKESIKKLRDAFKNVIENGSS